MVVFFFSSRRRHTRWPRDWSSDVCSSDLLVDQIRELLLRGDKALDLVLAPRCGRFFVFRDRRSAESLGDQPGALERRERARIDAQRPRALQDLAYRAVAVDHDQQAAQRDWQVELALLELAYALVGLGVDFTRIHHPIPCLARARGRTRQFWAAL